MTLEEEYVTIVEKIEYNPETGEFKWRSTISGHIIAGKSAGSVSPRGYLIIGINNKLYRAHRLAWFIYYKRWPIAGIDHIDRNKLNNKISNLREADQRINNLNRSDNKDFPCVNKTSAGRYTSYITISGKTHCLGTFGSKEDAHAKYLAAVEDYEINGAIPQMRGPSYERVRYNSTGERYIQFFNNRYHVYLRVDKKTKYFGGASTLEEAVKIRDAAVEYRKKEMENRKTNSQC